MSDTAFDRSAPSMRPIPADGRKAMIKHLHCLYMETEHGFSANTRRIVSDVCCLLGADFAPEQPTFQTWLGRNAETYDACFWVSGGTEPI